MASHLPDGLSPDAVDTLTELTSIIIKLRASQQPPSLTNLPHPSTAAAASNPLGHHHPNGPPSLPGPVTGTTPLASGGGGGGGQLLSVKELPGATDNLKHKLQRARAAVKTLPDVGRTISQQEVEIAELEARRRKQVEMLMGLKEEGLQFGMLEQRSKDEGERMVE
ncbi:RNA polymerase II transcription mediator complex subunit 9-domain-containing protein [Podospora appendiculata]|uniref:Mediator of RNA polymerase II transcription subunit 9 n=1 Tax=Podospora appendiculata TaxID=314037 RepID=A0AAE0XBJ0_9PEZI|nr:RNA polymerase II transcription mediator complex subunit 9-domain-containing protein [Podospora appendiculata]